MPNYRRIHPLVVVILLIFLFLLPLGIYTLSATVGGSTLSWLLPGANRDALEAEERLRKLTETLRAPTPDANSNQVLRVRFAATVPTPTSVAIFLPLVSQQTDD